MEKLKVTQPTLLFLQAYLIFNIFHGSQASIDESLNTTEQNDAAIIKYLNDNLPLAYHCCKGDETLQNHDWHVSCVDDNKIPTNISIDCRMPHFFEAPFSKSFGIEHLIKDEIVYYGSAESGMELDSNGSCFGNVTTSGEPRLMLIMCLDEEEELEEEVSEDMKEKAPIAGALSLLSTPFTLLVVIVYASVPEVRDLQGKSILCLCSSFLLSSVVIANEDLQILEVDRICHPGGDILYFTLMSSIFWMSAITTQTFFATLSFPDLNVLSRKQFVWYSCYGWGIPSILWMWAIIDDVMPGSLVLRSMDLSFNCWTYDDAEEWKYYLGPMTAVVITSCLFLLYSGVLAWKRIDEPLIKSLRYNFIMSVQIFVVVGISWLNEPLQRLHGQQNIMWIIGDCWNLLQGPLLFIMLILLRKRAMIGILKKYTFLKTAWLQNYTDRLTEDGGPVEIVAEENEQSQQNIFINKEAEIK